MHAKKIVDEMLSSTLSNLHAKLAEAVKVAVCGALRGGRLSLSQLARSLESATAMHHRVKRIDRLLANVSLHEAREQIYGEVAAQWLAGIDQILVVVDWSDATADQRWHLLRASVAVEGRSVTLYEEIHPRQKYGDRAVHRRFLTRIAALLPAGCMPIIMTDAGFRSTWFDLVKQHQWQWIGRIRGKDMVSIAGGPWLRCTEFYIQSNSARPIVCRCPLRSQQPDGVPFGIGQARSQRAYPAWADGPTFPFSDLAEGGSQCM